MAEASESDSELEEPTSNNKLDEEIRDTLQHLCQVVAGHNAEAQQCCSIWIKKLNQCSDLKERSAYLTVLKTQLKKGNLENPLKVPPTMEPLPIIAAETDAISKNGTTSLVETSNGSVISTAGNPSMGSDDKELMKNEGKKLSWIEYLKSALADLWNEMGHDAEEAEEENLLLYDIYPASTMIVFGIISTLLLMPLICKLQRHVCFEYDESQCENGKHFPINESDVTSVTNFGTINTDIGSLHETLLKLQQKRNEMNITDANNPSTKQLVFSLLDFQWKLEKTYEEYQRIKKFSIVLNRFLQMLCQQITESEKEYTEILNAATGQSNTKIKSNFHPKITSN